MKVNDVILLLDVSSLMKIPFNSLSENKKEKKTSEFMNIIETICKKRRNDEMVRISCIFFWWKQPKRFNL